MNDILRTRRSDEAPQLGVWVKIPAIETIELLAHAGYDFIVVDLEHGPLTLESCYRAIVVAQGRGLRALVRLPDASGSLTQRVLDMGADGLLVPHVSSATVAERVVRGMRFPPSGDRGLGTTSRAGTWGLDATRTYVDRATSHVVAVPQIEDPSAVADVDAICAVEGVDAVLLGLGDLTLSLGRPAHDPAVQEMVDHVLGAAGRAGIPCGAAVRTADAAADAARRGHDFILVGSDVNIFGEAARDLVAATRTALSIR